MPARHCSSLAIQTRLWKVLLFQSKTTAGFILATKMVFDRDLLDNRSPSKPTSEHSYLVAAITYICTMAAVYSQEIFWFGSVGDWNVVLWWKWLFDTPSPGIERRLEPRSHSSKWQTRGMTTEGIATPFKPLTYSGHQSAMVNGPSW